MLGATTIIPDSPSTSIAAACTSSLTPCCSRYLLITRLPSGCDRVAATTSKYDVMSFPSAKRRSHSSGVVPNFTSAL